MKSDGWVTITLAEYRELVAYRAAREAADEGNVTMSVDGPWQKVTANGL